MSANLFEIESHPKCNEGKDCIAATLPMKYFVLQQNVYKRSRPKVHQTSTSREIIDSLSLKSWHFAKSSPPDLKSMMLIYVFFYFLGLDMSNVQDRLLEKLEQCHESLSSPEPKGLIVDGHR